MKKTLLVLLAVLMCISLCACGGDNSTTNKEDAAQSSSEEVTQPPEEVAQPTEEEVAQPTEEKTIYKLGDVIETDLFKITPSFTGYAKKLANWPDKNYMTPAGTFSVSTPYAAEEEKTLMYGEIQIEYVGNEKSNVQLKIDISVDYDNGYVFAGRIGGNCISIDDDWEYDDEITFEPLSSKTSRIARYFAKVPEQVELDTTKSLLVTFSVNGKEFVYDFRSSEVLSSDYDPRGELYQPVDAATKNKIITYLKENGLKETGWYASGNVRAVGTYTFNFGDTTVKATLPINNSDYAYEFNGTYEVFSGTILLNWDNGEQMALDYVFDGATLDVVEFVHGK